MSSRAALLACLCALAAGLDAQDSIRLQDGTTVACEIRSLGRSGIRYREGGKESAVEYSKVASWTLDSPPARLRQGDAAHAARDHEGALAAYRGALAEIDAGKAREVHRQFVYAKIASAASARGDTAAALEALRALRDRCGDCRLRDSSYQQSIDIARAAKDRAALEAVLLEMRGEPEPLRGRADLELARARYEASSHEEALSLFSALAERTDQPYAPEAAIGRIRTLGALKRTELLVAAARSALESDSAPPGLIQAAGAALGDALLAGPADARPLRDAHLAFAAALSAGPPSSGEGAEEYAAALVGGARVSLLLSRAAGKEAEKQALRRRAASYWAEASAAWSRTEAVKAAAGELAELDAAPASSGG
jgi:hypothetical protein